MAGHQTALVKKEIVSYDYDESDFEEFLEKIEKVNSIKKILVFCSARIWIVNQVCSFIREKYPDAELSLLAQPSIKVKEEFEARADINEFFWMRNPSKKFGIFSLGLKMLKRLRNEKYDLVIVPLSGRAIKRLIFDQGNLHKVIMGIKPGHIIFLDSEGATISKEFHSMKYFFNYFSLSFSKIIGFTFIRIFVFSYMLFILAAIVCCDLWGGFKDTFGRYFKK